MNKIVNQTSSEETDLKGDLLVPNNIIETIWRVEIGW